MRTVSLLATAVFVLVLAAATAVDASVLAGKSKAPASAAKKARGEFIHPHKMRGGPQGSDNWGPVYNMAYNLLLAFQVRNYTAAASLIEDDALFAISALGCGTQTKEQVLAAAAADGALASYFQFGSWTGYDSTAMAALGTIATVLGSGPEANQTFIQKNVVFYFIPNQDGTKLSVIEQITDRSWAQPNNATKMANVWESMIEAANLHDVAAYSALLAPNARYNLYYAWDSGAAVTLNGRDDIIALMAYRWSTEQTASTSTNFMLVNCDFMVGYSSWSAVMKDGTAHIMNPIVAVRVDENMKVVALSDMTLMPLV